MALASIDDMLLALGEDTLRAIADHDGDRVVDDAAVTRALEDASDDVRGYIPSDLLPYIDEDSPPPKLRRVTVVLAAQLLREAREQVTEASDAAHTRAMRWLEQLAADKVSLVGVVVPPGTVDDMMLDPGDPEAEGQSRIWNRTSSSKVF